MAVETGYSGFAFPFQIGAKGGWLMSTTSTVDVAHIKESIRLIIGTYVGERVNEPLFGSEVHDVLFMNMDATLSNLLKFKVTEALTKWEPRISINNITVTWDDSDDVLTSGSVFATIDFTVLRTEVEDSVSVILRREGD